MSDAPAFTIACDFLESRAGLETLALRGTIRIVLKKSGLDPKTVRAPELAVAFRRLLADELASRGFDDPEGLTDRVTTALAAVRETDRAEDSPEQVFSRLGGA